MNKKVDEEFKYIHDEYMLQCTCTEMKDKINNLQSKIDKAIEYIEHYLKDIDNLDNVLINSILLKELLDILKEDK